MTAEKIIDELQSLANPEKAQFLQRFFKTGPGQYAEGDIFLGITNPNVRNIVKANKTTSISELRKMIVSKYHDVRLCALLIVVEQFRKATEQYRKELVEFYLAHTKYINNWDLVDLSCYKVLGTYLLDKDRSILYTLADSENLWEQRIAMVSTMALIKKDEFEDALALARGLITHKHDLMHKAVGWMLREIGKRDREVLTNFLENYATTLPRTALRYSIEHYPEPQRQYFLKMK